MRNAFTPNSERNHVNVHTDLTHKHTAERDAPQTHSDDVGSDCHRLLLLTEMISVLKVLNTIILFHPSLDLSLSLSLPSYLLQHLITLQI